MVGCCVCVGVVHCRRVIETRDGIGWMGGTGGGAGFGRAAEVLTGSLYSIG